MTEKQIAFKDYLFGRLGFVKDDHLHLYELYLERIANIYKKIGAIKKDDLQESDPKANFYTLQDGYWLPNNFGLVDFLYQEYNHKRKLLFEEVKVANKFISATDLANYAYCPVGYSISKSFKTKSNLLAEKSVNFHEQHRLIKKIKPGKKLDASAYESYVNDENKYFFEDVNCSELIFSGHSEEKRYFTNEEKKFVGQPDYIFKNKNNETFVIEEKFKQLYSNFENRFSNNHKVQLAAYIYYLNVYNIDYGYLVYWDYSYNDNEAHIQNCYVLQIKKDHEIKFFLEKTFQSITQFILDKSLKFDIESLKAKKCANCVHTFICSHKNKRIDSVSLPYEKSYFRLFPVAYPEILSNDRQ